MRTHAEPGFQVLRMHQKSCKVIAVHIQAEQDTDPYVVNPGFHGTVHSFCVISVIMFRAGRMQNFIVVFMICLLE